MFELLFKYSEAVFADGRLVLANLIDPGWWIAGVVLALGLLVASGVAGLRLSGLSWVARGTLAALQSAVAVLVLVVLMQPALQVETLKPGVNKVALVVDTSRSMGFADANGGSSRLAAATAVVNSLTDGLAGVAQVELYSFATDTAQQTAVTSLEASGGETHLLEALQSVLSRYTGAPLAGIIVASDGADTTDSGALTPLLASGVPVHVVGLGATELSGDTEITDVAMPVEVPPRSRVDANVTIRHSQPGRAVIRVLGGGQLLAALPVYLPEGQTSVRTVVPFDSGREGIRDLTFEVVPEEGDVLPENNRVQRLLTVSEQSRSVLYLEGEPRWEYRFIRRAVEGDDVLTLKSVLKTTDRKTYRQGVAGSAELEDGFPADSRTLFEFDLVVLGSLNAADLDEQQHSALEAFVSTRGGSLLALAGRNALADGDWGARPLARALPVFLPTQAAPTYTGVAGRARVTRDGALSGMTLLPESEGGDPWATLPPLGDYQRLGALKPAARTLLEFVVDNGTAAPLLVIQPYGLGSTAVLATSTTWRWQTRTPVGDPRHQLFWRQLLRQLAADAQRPTDISVWATRDTLKVRAALRSADFQPLRNVTATAVVTTPDGASVPLNLLPGDEPGVYEAVFTAGSAGVHRIDVDLDHGSPVTRFARLGNPHQEFFSPVQNVALLKRIAEASGGSYWTPETSAGIVEALSLASAGVRERQLLPLWDMPVVFIVLLVLKVGEWVLRRRWNRI